MRYKRSNGNRIGWLVRVAVVVLLLGGCRPDPPGGAKPATAKRSRELMGTFAEVTAVAADQATADAAVGAAYAALEAVSSLMNAYDPGSELSRLNRQPSGEPFVVSDATLRVLTRSAEVSAASGGAFDVTCRPLLKLWRQAAERDALPTADELAAVRAQVGWPHVQLDVAAGTVTVDAAGVEIDLGAIAKGFGLDEAVAALRSAGASAGLVNVGGDVCGFGVRADGSAWRIGIRHPFQQALYGQLELRDRAVATSGLQQRFFEVAGQRYSHIVDPRTGQPAAQAPSVTVLALDGATADAWATALSVLSVEEGRALVATLPDVEALWVWGDAQHVEEAHTAGFGAAMVD